jgi:hypothetical protein
MGMEQVRESDADLDDRLNNVGHINRQCKKGRTVKDRMRSLRGIGHDRGTTGVREQTQQEAQNDGFQSGLRLNFQRYR